MFNIQTLLSAVLVTGQSAAFKSEIGHKTFSAKGFTSAGSGAASVDILGSHDGSANSWVKIMTIALVLGTTQTADGDVSDAKWPYIAANVTAISGTDAQVTVSMGF